MSPLGGILPPRLPASGFPIRFAAVSPEHRVYTLCLDMSPLRGSMPNAGNTVIRTHPLGFAACHRLYAGGKKVRPYKALPFNALQKPLQKGADYTVNRC